MKFVLSKKTFFIYLLFIFSFLSHIKSLHANTSKNNRFNFNGALISDLSEQFQKQQASIWNDYNKCVDIYNSAEYIWSSNVVRGYIGQQKIIKNKFERPKIILKSNNVNDYIYKVVIDENRLIGLDHNKRLSFEEKCFQPVDQGLWRILIGKTYNLDRKDRGLSNPVDFQYVWNDNNKKDFLKTYIRTPGTELKEEVLIRKCSFKVKQKDLYNTDENGKYTISKHLNKFNVSEDKNICMNYEKRDENVKNEI